MESPDDDNQRGQKRFNSPHNCEKARRNFEDFLVISRSWLCLRHIDRATRVARDYLFNTFDNNREKHSDLFLNFVALIDWRHKFVRSADSPDLLVFFYFGLFLFACLSGIIFDLIWSRVIKRHLLKCRWGKICLFLKLKISRDSDKKYACYCCSNLLHN